MAFLGVAVRFIATGLVVASISACSSISGYRLIADREGGVERLVKVKGLPISVQTPTAALFVMHKRRYVVTNVYTVVDDAGNVSIKRQPAGEATEVTLSEKPTMLGPSEVYTIDPKRPMAGTIDYEIELKDQYPVKFKGKLEDKTLEEMRQLAKDLAEIAMKAAGVPTPTAPTPEKESGVTATVERSLIGETVSFVLVDLRTHAVTIKPL